MRKTDRVLVVGVAASMALVSQPSHAYPRWGRTERVSIATDGTQGNKTSFTPFVSADGRYVAFWSDATTLVPGDTNGRPDAFVRDRATGVTQRVSVTSSGAQANPGPNGTGSYYPTMSADNRFVVFHSAAANLVPDDTNAIWDVFVHDLVSGATERISVSSSGAQGSTTSMVNSSQAPAMSADGRYVVFWSGATNLVAGDTNASYDVFVRDRATGTTERVSVASDGTQANKGSFGGTISADGRYVVFEGDATNLVAGDVNDARDVFVHDRQTGVTELASVLSDGSQPNDVSFLPSVSADGRYVAFYSSATNIVPWDTNRFGDVFVHDRASGSTVRVSVSGDGTEGNGQASYLAISADGRFVAFQSSASNLVAGDTNGLTNTPQDVFVHDMVLGTTERVSVASDGTQSNNGTWYTSISADGSSVAFQSFASNLVEGDTNTFGDGDAFVHDRGLPIGVADLSVSDAPLTVSGQATFSGAILTSVADDADDGDGGEITGARLAYRHEAEDLVWTLDLASLPRPECTPFDAASAAICEQGGGLQGHLAASTMDEGPVSYRLEFEVDDTRYEVRALAGTRVTATAEVEDVATVNERPDQSEAALTLWRCDPDCVQVSTLAGAVGSTGDQVTASIPLTAVGASQGARIDAVRAFTVTAAGALSSSADLDDATLPDATLPSAEVAIGVAPAGSLEQDVDFNVPAALVNGSFVASPGSLPAGTNDVWARACLGTVCTATSAPVALS